MCWTKWAWLWLFGYEMIIPSEKRDAENNGMIDPYLSTSD